MSEKSSPKKEKKKLNHSAPSQQEYAPPKPELGHLKPSETTFLEIGKKVATRPLDVGGTWKLLYKHDGKNDEPPSMKSPTKKKSSLKKKKSPPSPAPASPVPMKIKVRTPDGKDIILTVKPTDTIDNVKDMVNDKEGIPKDDQRLLFQAEALDNMQTISDCNVKNGDTLVLEGMQIFVRHPNGNQFTLDVTPVDTIEDVKNQILKTQRIPKDQQRLAHDKNTLKDGGRTLTDYKIKHNSTLDLLPMQLHVKTPSGKKIVLTVDPNQTIYDVKDKVNDKAGIPVDEQRFVFSDQPLLDDRKQLSDYGIKHGDTVNMEPMQICVEEPNRKKTHTLDVEPTDTIGDVKKKIEKQCGIPEDQQRLKCDGKPLDSDNLTLRDCGIKHKSTLNLEPMQIHVKTPDGKKITLTVDPNQTIDDIKSKVNEKAGIPKDEQRFVFSDQPLDDRKQLSDYGIKHGDTVNMEPMQICVEEPNRKKTHTLDVEPTDTIGDVKKKIEKQCGIPEDQQRLKCDGKPLDSDNLTLRDCGIKHKSTLNLEPMQIHVKTPDGKKITLTVEAKDTVGEIKDAIHGEEGIPPAEQVLLFGGNELDNERTLDDCDIKHGSTLDLAPKPEPKPAAKPKAQETPRKSYLPVDWKKEQDQFGEITVTKYKSDYTVDAGKSHIKGKNVEKTSFKVNHTRKSENRIKPGSNQSSLPRA